MSGDSERDRRENNFYSAFNLVRIGLLIGSALLFFGTQQIGALEKFYVTQYCSPQWEWVQMGYECEQLFYEYVQEPIRASQWLLSGFLLLLAVLPSTLLQGWFIYLSWWVIPILLLLGYHVFTFPPYGGDGFNPIQFSVGDNLRFILLLLHAVTLFYVAVLSAYRYFRQR